jgi:hypothetical protein
MKQSLNQFAHNHSEELKTVGDVLFAGISGAALLEIIPAIAAGLSCIWLSVRLYEIASGRNFSETRFARWLTRRK